MGSKGQAALSVGFRFFVYCEVLFWCVRGSEVSSGSRVYRVNLNRGAFRVERFGFSRTGVTWRVGAEGTLLWHVWAYFGLKR